MTNFLSRPSLKSIRLIYCGLILGLVIFSTMSFSLIHSTGAIGSFDDTTIEYLLLVANFLPLIAIPTGILIAKKRLADIKLTGIDEKLGQFQSAIIVRAATIEGSGYFFLVCFALTGVHTFLFEAMAIIALQLYFFPNNSRISRELNLDLRELGKVSS